MKRSVFKFRSLIRRSLHHHRNLKNDIAYRIRLRCKLLRGHRASAEIGLVIVICNCNSVVFVYRHFL